MIRSGASAPGRAPLTPMSTTDNRTEPPPTPQIAEPSADTTRLPTLPQHRPSPVARFLRFLRLGLTAFGGPAMVAYVGFGLAAFVLMAVLSVVYVETRDLRLANSAFHGLQVIVVALVANATVTFGRGAIKGWGDVLLAIGQTVLVDSATKTAPWRSRLVSPRLESRSTMMLNGHGPGAAKLGLVATGLLVLWRAQGCSTLLADEPFYQAVTAADAETLLQSHADDPNFVIPDVRTAEEYTADHIAGAINLCVTCSDPVFTDALGALDKQDTYFVYCGSQHRSPMAITAMQEQGFLCLYELTGGLAQWQAASLPVVN
jgi:rhodanese-related sulfurtransferase